MKQVLFSLLALSFTFATAAQAEVKAQKERNSSGISSAEVFSLEVKGDAPSVKAVAEAVASRIRYGYHRQSYTISSWSLSRAPLSKALENLEREDGDFKGLSQADQSKLLSWIEDKKVVGTVYKMIVDGSVYGGGLTAVHYIFLPTEYSDLVLTIAYNQAAEE